MMPVMRVVELRSVVESSVSAGGYALFDEGADLGLGSVRCLLTCGGV